MSSLPSLAIFQCEACRTRVSFDAQTEGNWLQWNSNREITESGACGQCHGELWIVTVCYADTDIDIGVSALGLGLAAVSGVGFTQSSTSVNRFDHPGVNAADVARILADPSTRLQRVAEFSAARLRERMSNNGATECQACGILFVPGPNKPWSVQGFCSRMCALETQETAGDASRRGVATTNMIAVECARGHVFEVPRTFRGLVRKCPQCGVKTCIPE